MAAKTVLVVDDEPKVCELIKAYLEKDGYETIIAGDGKSAVDLARGKRPDLIVLDLNLPEMDGLETFRNIRTFSNMPIIMLTARDDEVDKIVGLQLGADDYVTKPFSPRELAARVTAVLRRYAEGPRAVTKLVVGDLQVDFDRHEVKYRNETVSSDRCRVQAFDRHGQKPGPCVHKAPTHGLSLWRDI